MEAVGSEAQPARTETATTQARDRTRRRTSPWPGNVITSSLHRSRRTRRLDDGDQSALDQRRRAHNPGPNGRDGYVGPCPRPKGRTRIPLGGGIDGAAAGSFPRQVAGIGGAMVASRTRPRGDGPRPQPDGHARHGAGRRPVPATARLAAGRSGRRRRPLALGSGNSGRGCASDSAAAPGRPAVAAGTPSRRCPARVSFRPVGVGAGLEGVP